MNNQILVNPKIENRKRLLKAYIEVYIDRINGLDLESAHEVIKKMFKCDYADFYEACLNLKIVKNRE